MSDISKSFSLLLILILAISSLIMAKPAFAQSIPTPPVPTFTVQYIFYTSYIGPTPTYTTNPYTGQNETSSSGNELYNQTLLFTIKNQPFTPYTDSSGKNISEYYNFRYKGHFTDQWSYYPFENGVTPLSYEYLPYEGRQFMTYPASDLGTTTISINLWNLFGGSSTDYPNQLVLPAGSQLDVQVQAQVGYIGQLPENGIEATMYGVYYNFTGESSGWSNTQTITVPEASSNSPNPTQSSSTTLTPTSTPTVPEFPTWIILPLFAVVMLLSTVFIRKRTPKKIALFFGKLLH